MTVWRFYSQDRELLAEVYSGPVSLALEYAFQELERPVIVETFQVDSNNAT